MRSSTFSRVALMAAAMLGASSGMPVLAPPTRVYTTPTASAPRRSRYPFSSTRQHDRHAERQYMVVINGFEIMNTVRRGGSAKDVGDLRNFPTGTHDDQIDGWMREIPPVATPTVYVGKATFTATTEKHVEWERA